MRRRGLLLHWLLFAFVGLCFIGSNAAAQTGSGSSDPEWTPTLTIPNDTTVLWCDGDSVCFDISAVDADESDTLILSLVSGPIIYEEQTFPYEFTTTVCFWPDAAGDYTFIWQLVDKQQHVVVDTVTYTVEMGSTPSIDDQQFSDRLCDLMEVRELPIVWDDFGFPVTVELLTGPGTLDPITGVLSYQPDTSGTFTFEVAVTGSCGADTAVITDQVKLNLPPTCIAFDTTVYLCDPEEICFDVLANDPDGDVITITQLEGLGQFTQTSDTSGTTCFTPANTAYAQYAFIYRSVDSCVVALNGTEAAGIDCCTDTVFVNVYITQPGELTCPGDTTLEFCVPPEEMPSEICIPGFESTWETTTVSMGTLTDGTLCFSPTQFGEYAIQMIGYDSCGHADTCTTTVILKGNNEPYITMADDFSVTLCAPETVCLSATADDLDFDIAEILVNFGTYDDATDRICFDADTSGVYEIIMTVTDECGATDTDTTLVTVGVNDAPLAILGVDFDTTLCETYELCIEAAVTDDNLAQVIAPFGTYNAETGTICFTPDTSGVYEIVLRAIDDCELVAEDTAFVTVDLNSAPIVSGLADSTVYLCFPRPICWDLEILDPDDDITDITTSHGTIENGQLCFTPYNSGTYEIIVTATDECGVTATDTAQLIVDTDQGIALECPGDTTVFLCEPDTLCFPIGGVPEGASVTVDGIASYWDEETQSVCFWSDCCLENELTVSVTTECGTYSCSFTVSVQTNTPPFGQIPSDTTVFLCEPEELCFPIGLNDIDGNIMSVDVIGATYDDHYNTVCFTPDTAGVYEINMVVTDSCGASFEDKMMVTVDLNHAPYVEFLEHDSTLALCELEAIYFRADVGDADSNLAHVDLASSGLHFTIDDGQIYDTVTYEFMPNRYGEHYVRLIYTDSCGLSDTAEARFNITQLQPVAIECPVDPILIQSCGPVSQCVDLPISGNLLSVETSLGVWSNGQLCIEFTEEMGGREIPVEIIATGECNVDTCTILFDVNVVTPPEVTCPGDQTENLCGPDTLQYQIDVSDPESPGAVYALAPAWVERLNGEFFVMVPVDAAGSQTVTVIQDSEPCDPDTCRFTVTATFNNPPTVTANDSTLTLCELEEICIPFWADDPDGDELNITSSVGTVMYELPIGVVAHESGISATGTDAPRSLSLADDVPPTGWICYTPEQFGSTDITITATDPCGAFDEASITITVNEGTRTSIVCPDSPIEPIVYCSPQDYCVDVTIEGDPSQVFASFGTFADGQLCFPVDTAGTYEIMLIADADCNSDTCTFTATFEILDPVAVACEVPVTDLFLCEGQTLTASIPVTITGDFDAVTIIPDTYSWIDGVIDVPMSDAGTQDVMVIATNACSADTCSFTVNATVNQPPTVNIDGTTLTQCEFEEICLPISFTDGDNGVVLIESNIGEIVSNESVCFTPTEYGDYEIIVTVTDECGATAEDTATVTVQDGQRAEIECPDGTLFYNIEVPGTLNVPLVITPFDVEVIVSPSGFFDATNGELVVDIEEPGVHQFQLIANAECNSDTCEITIEVGQYQPPTVDCQGTVDTALCLTEPTTLCLPVTIAGTDVVVMVEPIGEYSSQDGTVCIPVDTAGTYMVDITAYNDRDTVTCTSEIVVTTGNPPMLTMADDFDEVLCQPSDICFPVTIQDTDFDIVQINVNNGVYSAMDGNICFYADTAGVYEIITTVSDNCDNTVVDTTVVTVDLNEAPVVVTADDFSTTLCEPGEICFDVDITTDDDVTLETSFGTYDPATGQVCFDADTAGVYDILVTATDECDISDSDNIQITVGMNSAPMLTSIPDTSVYLCFPRPICLPVDFTDFDDNVVSVEVSQGTYSDGEVCFTPYSAGSFEIVVTVTDECGLTDVDTAMIEVATDQEIELVCPGDTTIFLCEPDTICFPVYGIPEGAEVTVDGIASYWNAETQSVCFWSDCCLENELTVTATTECGSYSCSFTVSVQTNTPPLVTLPPDMNLVQCQLEQVCIPVGINDIDGNIETVVASFGDYDDYRNEICFTPDTAGVYTIEVTATDSCGGFLSDQIAITIDLNDVPEIGYEPLPEPIVQCTLEEVCLPVSITDPNDNIADITVTGGTYDSDQGVICFTPEDTGLYCLTVVVTDACDLRAELQICEQIVAGDSVMITCPTEAPQVDPLCFVDNVCIPLEIVGTGFEVTTSYGEWADGELCFLADSTGTYSFTVIATAECNADTCEFTVPVEILDPLAIQCPGNDEQFLCGPDTLCYEFTYAPMSATVSVTEPAYIDGNMVCVPVLEEGEQTIMLRASNQCGQVECSFTVTTDFNAAPVVTLPPTQDYVECEFAQVCIPLTIADEDDNLTVTGSSLGTIEGDSLLCFTPTAFGAYEIIVTAEDACGEIAADTVVVTYSEGDYAAIECPDGTQFASICGPTTVCVIATITPADAEVTVLPDGSYNPETGEICVPVDSGGTWGITVIAEAQCGSDTCEFNLEVDYGVPAELTCPDAIDTTLCLVETDTLCIPVEATGTGVEVSVSPSGYYSAGFVCVPISEAGDYDFEIIAAGSCGSDTCHALVTVTADEDPVMTVPEGLTFERCPDDEDEICIDGIFATDAESDVFITQVCGPGQFTGTTGDSGQVCFLPETFGTIEFCFEYTDGCHIDTVSMFVEIDLKPDCDVCVRLSLDGGECTPVGRIKEVALNIESNDEIGGFDILLDYDESALTYQDATLEGGAAEDWEYFTWNLNPLDCSGCGSGMIRLFGIADANNGAAHPPEGAFSPNGVLIYLYFLVANDQNLGDVFIPINFVWYDCADNSVSDRTGQIQYVELRIFNGEGGLIWDETDDAMFPETSRPLYLGTPDSCIGEPEEGKPRPLRCIEFYNGGICVVHPDSIDDRGDINLNGLAYEIADAVLFTRYFTEGLAAFTYNIAGQIAASDVNADGLTLTVADLTYLIRVVVGDADPIPKATPHAQIAEVSTSAHDGKLRIESETHDNVAVGYFVFELEPGSQVNSVATTETSRDFDLGWSIHGNELKVLMYDIGSGRLEAGANELFDIDLEGAANLVHAELVDYLARPYRLNMASSVPTSFMLHQNYPNPFNPSTTIQFELPTQSQWELTVFNIQGAVVKSFSGTSSGGQEQVVWDGDTEGGLPVASGVYFYRLSASSFSETRKMILLK